MPADFNAELGATTVIDCDHARVVDFANDVTRGKAAARDRQGLRRAAVRCRTRRHPL